MMCLYPQKVMKINGTKIPMLRQHFCHEFVSMCDTHLTLLYEYDRRSTTANRKTIRTFILFTQSHAEGRG